MAEDAEILPARGAQPAGGRSIRAQASQGSQHCPALPCPALRAVPERCMSRGGRLSRRGILQELREEDTKGLSFMNIFYLQHTRTGLFPRYLDGSKNKGINKQKMAFFFFLLS